MSLSLIALLGFAAWTLFLLVAIIAPYRVGRVLSGHAKSDSWTRGRAIEDPAFIQRVSGAQANCLENLPIVAAVILVAAVSGQSAITDCLALWLLAARIGQSLSHMISVHHLMIFFVRFPLFLIQVAILVYWFLALANVI
ncbi:MAG: MAPEG family protein [Salinisphaera sp.]|nr:MAPEG family protein [Salinisphaera sp.]